MPEQVQIIEQHVFKSQRLEVVRDIFIVQCYTGLSQADIEKLTVRNLVVDESSGEQMLDGKRTKTKAHGCSYKIPVLPIVQSIFEKYKDHPGRKTEKHLLPHRSNQKMNDYVKEIQTECRLTFDHMDISEGKPAPLLSSNVGRHTFATMMLSNGVSERQVADMLGHSTTKQVKHYGRIINSRLCEDVNEAYENIRRRLSREAAEATELLKSSN